MGTQDLISTAAVLEDELLLQIRRQVVPLIAAMVRQELEAVGIPHADAKTRAVAIALDLDRRIKEL